MPRFATLEPKEQISDNKIRVDSAIPNNHDKQNNSRNSSISLQAKIRNYRVSQLARSANQVVQADIPGMNSRSSMQAITLELDAPAGNSKMGTFKSMIRQDHDQSSLLNGVIDDKKSGLVDAIVDADLKIKQKVVSGGRVE